MTAGAAGREDAATQPATLRRHAIAYTQRKATAATTK